MRPLDLKAVRAFVTIADRGGFTRAAEALDSTQAAVSVLLKRLEARLGQRLIERTPRALHLSAAGAAFLEPARELLRSHEQALAALQESPRRLIVGLSHHLMGEALPTMLAAIAREEPGLRVSVQVDGSKALLEHLGAGRIDAAFVLSPTRGGRAGGSTFEEPFGWFVSRDFHHVADQALPIATQGASCAIRQAAVRALDQAGIAWVEHFVGLGAATVGRAAAAGLAVAVISRRAAPRDTIDVGERFGLPALPGARVHLHSRLRDARTRRALRLLGDALQGAR